MICLQLKKYKRMNHHQIEDLVRENIYEMNLPELFLDKSLATGITYNNYQVARDYLLSNLQKQHYSYVYFNDGNKTCLLIIGVQ